MKYFLTLVLALFSSLTFGQAFGSKNAVSLELGGHGLYYSINYERLIFNGDRFKTTGQLGIAYYPSNSGPIQLWIPVLLNELITFGNSHAEIGAGYILTNETKNVIVDGEFKERIDGFLTARLAYRYQNPKKMLFYRIGFTPIIEYGHQWFFHPTGGASIGLSF